MILVETKMKNLHGRARYPAGRDRWAGFNFSLLTCAAALLLATNAAAQNPSFAGQEFRRVWVAGTTPPGATETPRFATGSQAHLTSAGVFIEHRLYGNGIYYADDAGANTVVTADQAEFSEAAWFTVMGRMADGGLLFSPVTNTNDYPCQVYNGDGLNGVTSPTPEQSLTLGNYFDGRFVYLEHTGMGGTRVWYYTEGNPPVLWFENTVAGILDYDGESLAYATGTTGAFHIWIRSSDGTLTRIIGQGDALPGSGETTLGSTPDKVNVEVDQGRVYVLGAGSGFQAPQVLFSSTNGVNFDVIAERGQEVPGLTGVTITEMMLMQVQNGKVWLRIVQSDGDHVLYQIIGDTWTRVAGKTDSYDGQAPIAFDVFEHGMLEDRVVVAVSFLDFSSPTYYATDLYVNGDLPGFSSSGGGLVLAAGVTTNGDWSITAEATAGNSYTLQASPPGTNLVWEAVGEPVVAEESGPMVWTANTTNDAQFFRLLEE